MSTDEKLAAILAAVQTDPGRRGLGCVPDDNLLTATAADFALACLSLTSRADAALDIDTGFYIPTGNPPAYETDGPLGALFLLRALSKVLQQVAVWAPPMCHRALQEAADYAEIDAGRVTLEDDSSFPRMGLHCGDWPGEPATHHLAIECVGPALDGKCYSMRGQDISAYAHGVDDFYWLPAEERDVVTIGIGDGGNEIGMGKLPHELVEKNIPNGSLIHCRVPTDFLIVAGVSNWGAYALAAGIYAIHDIPVPANLFDPDYERELLEIMVREGPLVDGVTGKTTATVDSLSWDDYSRPLRIIREILG